MSNIGEYRRKATKNADGSWSLGEKCLKTNQVHNIPRKISNSSLKAFLPFNHTRTRNLEVENVFSKFGLMNIPDFVLKSGQVYESKEGRRLVLEVGCTTIIYMLVTNKGAGTYQFYVQELYSFARDVTIVNMASKVAKSTSFMKTIVKYEMYFILGIVSTLSVPLLITVVGVDILKTTVTNKEKAKAARELSKVLIAEHHNLATYAPTLHLKLKEFITADATINLKTYGYKLGKTIVKDQQVQGELAGALFAKALILPKTFNFWAALTTVLVTSATKSASKTPTAYLAHYGDRYKPIMDDLMQVNWDDQQAANKAGEKIVVLMQDSGVKLSPVEAVMIINEIKLNSIKLVTSLVNINIGLNDFLKVINE